MRSASRATLSVTRNTATCASAVAVSTPSENATARRPSRERLIEASTSPWLWPCESPLVDERLSTTRPRASRASYGGDDLVELPILGQTIDGTRLQQRLGLARARGRRGADDGRARARAGDRPGRLHAVEGRQAVVEQHDVGPLSIAELERLGAVARGADDLDVGAKAEQQLERLTKDVVVLDEEEPHGPAEVHTLEIGAVLDGLDDFATFEAAGADVGASRFPVEEDADALEVRLEAPFRRHHRVAAMVSERRLFAADCADLRHGRGSLAKEVLRRSPANPVRGRRDRPSRGR